MGRWGDGETCTERSRSMGETRGRGDSENNQSPCPMPHAPCPMPNAQIIKHAADRPLHNS
ncbi:hypothetical protein [Nostoc linckia]|uniref:hypothetical protein n=1 Tax=Nostoc linckia TaxID=92942 RepID=UPI00117F96D7|nr:hypothetical protein [Nostoc linckia]